MVDQLVLIIGCASLGESKDTIEDVIESTLFKKDSYKEHQE